MTTLIRVFLLIIGLAPISLAAQRTVNGDSLIFNVFQGKYSQIYRLDKGIMTKNGAFKFESQVIQDSISNEFNKLSIQGSYKDNLYHGYWTFSELIYNLQINNIIHNKRHLLEYSLNGSESRVVMRFNNGKATGRWMIDNYKIENGLQKDLQNSGYIFCEDGFYTGAFSFANERENISISGNMNGSGFLQGVLRISWMDSLKRKITEERLYHDGFLLQISRFENGDTKPFMFIEYTDVQKLITDIQNSGNGTTDKRIKMSESHYGVVFDNGYTSQDLRLTMQRDGNEIIERFLSSFDRYLSIETPEFEKPIAKLTRRFVFDYADPDNWNNLNPKLDYILTKTKDFISTPSNILYATQSDSVARAMALMTHIYEKTLILQDVIDKNLSGFFETRDRNNYYANGVPGLNKSETVIFRNRKNEEVKVDFTPTTLIDSPEDFLNRVDAYLVFLQLKYDKNQLIAFTKVADLEQREKLKNIDSLIIHFEQLNETFFGEIAFLSNTPFENLRFEQKIFLLAYQRKLSQLRKNYLAKIEFEEKVDVGLQYIDAMQNLSENQMRLSEIGRRQKRIDSIFTIYEDNPFDYRQIELPILSHIKEKGLLLFRHYAEQLFAETRPERFVQRVAIIEQLLDKLEYYAANYKNPEVQSINRSVRRESVPNRIERLFEISIENETE